MNLSRRSVLAGTGVVLAGGLGYAYTQRPKHLTVRPTNPGEQPAFGVALSLSADGSTALVGLSDIGDGFVDRGAASVFERTGNAWSHQTRFDRPSDESAAEFGSTVALSGDGTTAVVGSRQPYCMSGNVEYPPVTVYERADEGWDKTAEFDDETTGVGCLGVSLAVSHDGEEIGVGTPYRYPTSSDRGSVSVFDRSDGSWSRATTIQAPDFSPGIFRESVAMAADGTTLAVAVPSSERPEAVGTVVLYERIDGEWTETDRLQGRVADGSERNLDTVAISDDSSTILASNTAATIVFERTTSGWVQRTTIDAPSSQEGPRVGDSLALSADGQVGVVGSTDPVHGGEGKVQIVRRAGGEWEWRSVAVRPDREPHFGTAVDVSDDGTTVMIGDPNARYRGKLYVGAAYVFDDAWESVS